MPEIRPDHRPFSVPKTPPIIPSIVQGPTPPKTQAVDRYTLGSTSVDCPKTSSSVKGADQTLTSVSSVVEGTLVGRTPGGRPVESIPASSTSPAGVSHIQGVVQNYPWGSKDAIANLLGVVPDGQPQAELWLGAHPKAPARLDDSGRTLDAAIASDPEAVLGPAVAKTYQARLPFLLKVLSADRPLSIQCHPTLAEAQKGFAAENAAGIPLDAKHRNYRDDNHKPELICALTPFTAMKGFRAVDQTIALFESLDLKALEGPLQAFRQNPTEAGLETFYSTLMSSPKALQTQLATEAVEVARAMMASENADPAYALMIDLADQYPGDIGVLNPLLLNIVELKPGQALFLPAGELHAYVKGTGMELMANSDNVIRGGLTSKHMDVDELLRLLSFSFGDADILAAREIRPGYAVYDTPAPEFQLSRIDVTEAQTFESGDRDAVEILLCTEGAVTLQGEDGGTIFLAQGQSAVVEGTAGKYRLEGEGRLFMATVND